MDDRALVERQLGRPPRAFRRVAARCPFGAPAVTEQWPYDDAGDPFPTTYYLTCPHLVAAIARLEAAGGVERWSEEVERDPELAADLERATARAAADPPRARRRDGRPRRRLVARARDRRQRATRGGSSACTRTPPTRSPTRATSLGERILAEVEPRWPPRVLPRIRRVITEAEVESARREWEEGYRRLLERGARATRGPSGCSRRSTSSRPSCAGASAARSRSRELAAGVRRRRALEPRGRRGARAGAGLAANALARRGGGVPRVRPRRPGLRQP